MSKKILYLCFLMLCFSLMASSNTYNKKAQNASDCKVKAAEIPVAEQANVKDDLIGIWPLTHFFI